MAIDKEWFLQNAGNVRIVMPDGTEYVAEPTEFKSGSFGWMLDRRAKPECTVNGEAFRVAVGCLTVSGSKPLSPPTDDEKALLGDGLGIAVAAYRARTGASRSKALRAFGLE